jgi:O-methyltransferase domain
MQKSSAQQLHGVYVCFPPGRRTVNTEPLPGSLFTVTSPKDTYIGGPLEQLNSRLYQSWGQLTDALRAGVAPSGQLATGGYAALYADKPAFEMFLKAMTGGSLLPARQLAAKFPWRAYNTVIDIGTAQGCVPVEIARVHPHLSGGGFDLPQVESSFA